MEERIVIVGAARTLGATQGLAAGSHDAAHRSESAAAHDVPGAAQAGLPDNRLAEFRHLATQATSSTVEHVARAEIFKRIAGVLAETIKARQEKREDDLTSLPLVWG